VLRARLRAWDLSHGARRETTTPAAGRLVARCAALYRDCLHAAAHALARVTHMPAYDDGGRVAADDAVAALRVFPEKCQRLFDAQEIVSPLEQVNRDTEDKLRVASEIVHLLRRSRLEPPSPSRHGDVERTNV
jgi:hypothetical protein